MSARLRNGTIVSCIVLVMGCTSGDRSGRTADMSVGGTGGTGQADAGSWPAGDLATASSPDLAAAGAGDLALASSPDLATASPPDLAAALPAGLTSFTSDAAHAVCRALYRCCDDTSLGTWFSSYTSYYANDPVIKALTPQLPPNAPLTAEACPAVVQKMFDAVPLGSWVTQVEAGRVSFDAAAVTACIADLDGAACGSGVAAALYDGACFSFSPPVGGAVQRRMFHRTHQAGDDCAPVRDGMGGVYYGTCDPTAAFCCVTDPAKPASGCITPTATSIGTCQATAKAGDACREYPPPLQLCATGFECDSQSASCVAPATTPLAAGAACVDANNNLLGNCQLSWCDVFGTKNCELFKDDDADCTTGDECTSGACNSQKCGAPTLCLHTRPAGVTTLPVPDIKSPVSVVFDPKSGTLWASFDDHTVRNIDATTGALLVTLGSAGASGATDSPPLFKSPAGIAVDATGAVYVADTGNHAVRKIAAAAGGGFSVTTVAKDVDMLAQPVDVAVVDAATVLVADSSACAIRRIVGGQLTTVLDNDDALGRPCLGSKLIYFPRGLVWDAPHKLLYVAEMLAHRIDVIDLSGATPAIHTIAGTGSSGAVDGPGATATFNMPSGMTFDAAGALLVAEQGGHRIRRVAIAGSSVSVRTLSGSVAADVDGALVDARFNGPSDITGAGDGSYFVADRGNSKIRRLAP